MVKLAFLVLHLRYESRSYSTSNLQAELHSWFPQLLPFFLRLNTSRPKTRLDAERAVQVPTAGEGSGSSSERLLGESVLLRLVVRPGSLIPPLCRPTAENGSGKCPVTVRPAGFRCVRIYHFTLRSGFAVRTEIKLAGCFKGRGRAERAVLPINAAVVVAVARARRT